MSKENLKILMTGISSCTGSYFAEAFREYGNDVYGVLTKNKKEYASPLYESRFTKSGITNWIESAPFGSQRLIDAIREIKPDIFLHHGASLKRYRDPNFDVEECVHQNCEGSDRLFEALKISGCKRFIYSGTFFEPVGDAPAVSLYGFSKYRIWQEYLKAVQKVGIAATKIYIPNPVGPLENPDRLIPSFVKMWKTGETPTVKTPYLVRDNIPVPWLARRYAEVLNTVQTEPVKMVYPSGYVLKNIEFLQLFLKWVEKLGGHKFSLIVQPVESSEPISRFNNEPCRELKSLEEENKFWTGWLTALGLV